MEHFRREILGWSIDMAYCNSYTPTSSHMQWMHVTVILMEKGNNFDPGCSILWYDAEFLHLLAA